MKKQKIFTGFIIISAIICAYLGIWQWQRLNEKTIIISNFNNSIKNPKYLPVNNPNLSEFEIFSVNGKFIKGKDIKIGPRSHNKKSGIFLFSLFKTIEGDEILINRGFVTKDLVAKIKDEERENFKIVVRAERKKQWYMPSNNLEKKQIHFVKLEDIAQLLKIKTPPRYFQIFKEENKDYDIVIPILDKDYKFFNPHLQYIFFWFILSITLIILLIIYRKKNA